MVLEVWSAHRNWSRMISERIYIFRLRWGPPGAAAIGHGSLMKRGRRLNEGINESRGSNVSEHSKICHVGAVGR